MRRLLEGRRLLFPYLTNSLRVNNLKTGKDVNVKFSGLAVSAEVIMYF